MGSGLISKTGGIWGNGVGLEDIDTPLLCVLERFAFGIRLFWEASKGLGIDLFGEKIKREKEINSFSFCPTMVHLLPYLSLTPCLEPKENERKESEENRRKILLCTKLEYMLFSILFLSKPNN